MPSDYGFCDSLTDGSELHAVIRPVFQVPLCGQLPDHVRHRGGPDLKGGGDVRGGGVPPVLDQMVYRLKVVLGAGGVLNGALVAWHRPCRPAHHSKAYKLDISKNPKTRLNSVPCV